MVYVAQSNVTKINFGHTVYGRLLPAVGKRLQNTLNQTASPHALLGFVPGVLERSTP